jgi:hypothetical protein
VYGELGKCIATADAESAESLREARRAIEVAVQWLVPCICEGHVDIHALRDKVQGAARIIDLPCAITSIAEIYIAAVERRTTEFWPRDGQADWPQGKRHLPWRDPPFEGMTSLTDERAAIHEMFGAKLAVGDIGLDEARVRLDDFMVKTLAYSAGLPRDPIRRKKIAARELESQAKGNFRRYLVCRIPIDDTVRRKATEDNLEEIARDYPALVIVRLYEGAEARDEEFWDFKDMLPLQGDGPGDAP